MYLLLQDQFFKINLYTIQLTNMEQALLQISCLICFAVASKCCNWTQWGLVVLGRWWVGEIPTLVYSMLSVEWKTSNSRCSKQ